MDEEYKKVLIKNCFDWGSKTVANECRKLEAKGFGVGKIILELINLSWLEATKQADERNKCLNSVYHMANNNTKSI